MRLLGHWGVTNVCIQTYENIGEYLWSQTQFGAAKVSCSLCPPTCVHTHVCGHASAIHACAHVCAEEIHGLFGQAQPKVHEICRVLQGLVCMHAFSPVALRTVDFCAVRMRSSGSSGRGHQSSPPRLARSWRRINSRMRFKPASGNLSAFLAFCC